MSIKINLIKVRSTFDLNFYTGSIRLGDLLEVFDVPIYRPQAGAITGAGNGYQREPKPTRVADVAKRITTLVPGGSVPNTEAFVDNVNLNLRNPDAESYVKPLHKNSTSFGDMFEFEYIENLGDFMVVDGQTRLKGAELAIFLTKQEKDFELVKKIQDIRVQVTLTFCKDEFKEAYVFYLINNYAKAIPPDGATRLLYEGMKNNKVRFINEVTRANKNKEVEAMKVAEQLSSNSQIWAGYIKDFNETGADKISIRAICKIIQPLYQIVKDKQPEGASISTDSVVFDTVEAYWLGFKQAYPMMFDVNSHSQYNVLKAGPAEIMMKVLVNIFTLSRRGTRTGSMQSAPTFAKILKAVLEKTRDTNPLGDAVSGSELFLVGKKGSMGKYSNNAAKNDMAKAINVQVFKYFKLPTP
jgi:hypothetical protein|tara:strand:- start:3349 stop:4584 length:1236 start_codon:yes stop_codon:yes gene_type:complete